MVYTNVLAAVVSALAAECIDNTSKQSWQKLISASLASGRRPAFSDASRMEVDCWVFSRLHSQLPPKLWNVLVAKYSTHKARKVQAIGALFPVVQSPAPALFRQKAITAWAIPPMKGVQAAVGAEVASRAARQAAQAEARAKQARHKAQGKKGKAPPDAPREQYVKRSTDVMVLPASFYDMNSWDTTAAPDRTRRWWRSQLNKGLEEMVTEALMLASEVLDREGVIHDLVIGDPLPHDMLESAVGAEVA